MTIRFIGNSGPGQFGRGPGREQEESNLQLNLSAAGEVGSDEEGGKVNLRAYWRSLRKRRWSILLLAAVVTTAAFIYAQSIQPVFRSTTTLLIEAGKAKILSIEEVYNAVSQDREYYQTQVEILRSNDVALRTVQATQLWDEPEFDPRKPVRSWQGRIKDFINPPPPPEPWTLARLADAAVAKYLGAISIEPVRLSQLVKISFEAADRELAAKVADATANAYIQTDRDARLKLNQSVNTLLQDRMLALRERLKQSEDELQRFRERSGLVNVGGSQGIAAQQMAEIGQRLIAARVRRTELESAFQQVERVKEGEYLSLPLVSQQPGLAESRNRVALVSLQVEELTRTLGDQHSRVIDARNALTAAQRELALNTRSAVSSLRREAAAARETERSLQAALDGARSAVQGVNRQEFQLQVLEREVQANRQLHELFLSRAKETSVSSNLQSAVARIVDSARPATAPLRPNKPQIIMIALLLSLTAGGALAISLDKLADTLNGSEEAETRLRHPVLAALPEVRGTIVDRLDSRFVNAPKSGHANAIRRARTQIVLADLTVAHKVMMVTSSVDGEGKTSFCTDLAFSLAQAKRTLLIDCDLHNPQIHVRLGLPPDAKGICDLGNGSASVNECVHAVPGSTLLVMPAGAIPEFPEELLLSAQFRETLRSLANRVDVVLIDTPPISAGSFAMIISQFANDTIYVVKARDTAQSVADNGLRQLHRAGASVLGLVLTNTEPNASDSESARDLTRFAAGRSSALRG